MTNVEVGDTVIVHPFITCGLCRACRCGDDMHCENGSFPGINRDGGFAEFLLTSARSVVKLDPSLQPAEIAALADAGLTAIHAVKKAIPVLGAGTKVRRHRRRRPRPHRHPVPEGLHADRDHRRRPVREGARARPRARRRPHGQGRGHLAHRHGPGAHRRQRRPGDHRLRRREGRRRGRRRDDRGRRLLLRHRLRPEHRHPDDRRHLARDLVHRQPRRDLRRPAGPDDAHRAGQGHPAHEHLSARRHQRRDGGPRRRAAPGPRDPRPRRRRRPPRRPRHGQATALQPRGPPAAPGRRRRAGQHRQGHARAEGAQRRPRAAHRARRRSPTTASRSPARSSSPTSSRTWARSSSARSPTRRATSPATARRPPRCSPRPSCAKACARSTRAPTRCCCAAASRRRPRCLVAELQRIARPVEGREQLAHIATIAAKEDEVIGKRGRGRARPRRRRGRRDRSRSPSCPASRVDFVEGMHVENGWISPYMVTRPRRGWRRSSRTRYILMTAEPISHPQDLMPDARRRS